MNFLSRLLVFLSLSATHVPVTDGIQRDENFRSTFLKAYPGYALNNHVFAHYHVTYELSCGMRCLSHSNCLSYNYMYQSNSNWETRIPNCHLNDKNRITTPEDYVVKSGVIYYEALDGQSDKDTVDVAEQSYDLTFPGKDLTSYVSLNWPTDPNAPVNNFTLCFWMKTDDLDIGAPFSYAVPNCLNEVAVHKDMIYIHDEYRYTSLENYYDGIWHHVCLAWRNTDGYWRLFLDSAVISSGTSFQNGHVIQTGGTILVGQEQDDAPGDPNGFSLSQSFLGSISGMNLWNKAFGTNEVLPMSQTCDTQGGNVLQWSEFQVSLHGNVIVESPSSCQVPVS